MRTGLKTGFIAMTILGICTTAWGRGEPDAHRLAACSNNFGWALFDRLATGDGNLLISPHSLHAALGMTQPGARGETAKQIAYALALSSMEHAVSSQPEALVKIPHPEWLAGYRFLMTGTPNMSGIATKSEKGFALESVNALWAQKGYPFRKEYLDEVNGLFGSVLREIDFAREPDAARKTINDAIEKQTHDKIKELLKPDTMTPMTRLVLTNAVYFKAAWAEPFEKEATRDEPFKLTEGTAVNVPTMHQMERMAYVTSDTMRGVRLMYAGGHASMTIVLPREGKTLTDTEKDVSRWLDGLLGKPSPHTQVALSLPRFKFEADYDMVPPLQMLGMVDAFDPDKADFSGMNDKKDLYVSAVVQKTFIDVNEEGTEAAAASAVVIKADGMPMDQPVEFRADRPFLFVIRHEPTGTILFIGRVTDPRPRK